MYKCPTIISLKLDSGSINRVKKIKSINEDIKGTGILLSVGIIFNIFTKASVPAAAFNISQTDWEVFSKSSSHLNEIKRNLIRIEAMTEKMRHTRGSKQRKFWEAVANGCAI